MSTFFHMGSDDSIVSARKDSEPNPSPLSQQPAQPIQTKAETAYQSQISFTLDTICPW